MSWHVDPAVMERYARQEVGPADAASIEAHLVDCGACRARLHVDPARLDRLWAGVADVVDEPSRNPVEALLRQLGVRDRTARLVAATPALHMPWLVAMAVTVALAVVAATAGDRGFLFFLVLAPVLPIAGVAAAYGPRVDPMYELTVAAPMPAFELLLLRSTAVLTSTVLLVGVAAIPLAGEGWLMAAWLLPALGLTMATLALSTVMSPIHAGVGLASTWAAVAFLNVRGLAGGDATGDLASRVLAFSPAGQALFLTIAVIGTFVVIQRRETLEIRSNT